MKRTLMFVTSAVVAAMVAQVASAAMIAGQYVPDSLVGQVGAQYRLIFVTSGSTNADSADPADYDDFLATQVQGTMLGGVDYGWKAVVSTAAGDSLTPRIAKTIVKDDGYTFDPNAPYAGVFNTAGAKVAATGNAMLTANPAATVLLAPVLYDQHGTTVAEGYAWTGSTSNGDPATAGGGVDVFPATVGSNYMTYGAYTMLGAPEVTTGQWLQFGVVSRGGPIPWAARIYGMSDVMTVPVPEPGTVVLWSLAAGVAGLVYWRKRR